MRKLWKHRKDFNDAASSMMRETEVFQDIVELALEDVTTEFMIEPVEPAEENKNDILISRRIQVREWNNSLEDLTTMQVDHGSESDLKDATSPDQKAKVQGMGFLVTMSLKSLYGVVGPRLLKRT